MVGLGPNIFVISDIHGCDTELKLLLNKLPLEPKESKLVFLGDYIDRGQESKQVIDTIMELKGMFDVVTLMGNHEEMFVNFLDDPKSKEAVSFVYNGGGATLTSYGDDKGKYYVPNNHMEFYKDLKLYHETSEYFFVHAGVPDVPLSKIDPEEHRAEMLWVRQRFLDSEFKWEKMVIHGHTPHKDVEVTKHRVNIDTGCVFGGKLTALMLPEYEFFHVEKQDRPQFIYLRDMGSRRSAIRFEGGNTLYVYHGDEVIPMDLVNYSETGMLLADTIIKSKEKLFAEDEIICGEIGHKYGDIVQFECQMVRFVDLKGVSSYGVKFLKKPGDFLFEHYSRVIKPEEERAPS